jgi:hypothetical protein
MDAEYLLKTFPYEYKGGGYFRRKGVKKGEVAEIIHGDEIVKKVIEHILNPVSNIPFNKK